MLIAASFWLIAAIGALIAQSEVAAAAKPREVKGLVVDETGKPIAGVGIAIYDPSRRAVPEDVATIAKAVTGIDGRFAFAGADVGPHSTLWLVGANRLATVVEVQRLGEPIVLGKACRRSGRVVDDAGRPVAGAYVLAEDAFITARWVGLGDGKPRTCTATCSDADGRFVLNFAAAEGMILRTFTPDGIAEVGPLATDDPIELRLLRTATLTVEVVDGADRPIADAEVEVLNGGLRGRTDRAGMLRLPWLGADDVMVVADVAGESRGLTQVAWQGDTTLRYVLPGHPPLRIRATSGGKPLREFRAAAFWAESPDQPQFEPGGLRAQPELHALRSFAQVSRAAVDGEVAVPFPDAESIRCIVAAPGHALVCERVQAGASLDFELPPAQPIVGVVVDGATGDPVAGARLWSQPVRSGDPALAHALGTLREHDPELGVAVTDGSGAFALPFAGDGAQVVCCVTADGTSSEPVAVPAIRDQPRAPLRLVVHARAQIVLRTGVHWPAGTSVGLWRSLGARSFRGDACECVARAAVDEAGNAAFAKVPAGAYRAVLAMPQSWRPAAVGPIELGTCTIAVDTREVVLDGSKVRPAIVRGRVHSSVPAGRLVVQSIALPSGPSPDRWQGPCALIGAAGTFELEVPPGERALLVFDFTTHVPLYHGAPTKESAGGERSVDLDVQAHRVQLQLRGARPDLSMRRTFVLQPSAASWPERLGVAPDVIGADLSRVRYAQGYACVMEVTMPADMRPLDVWLPHAPVSVRLWEEPHEFNRMPWPQPRAEQVVEDAGAEPTIVVFDLGQAK